MPIAKDRQKHNNRYEESDTKINEKHKRKNEERAKEMSKERKR